MSSHTKEQLENLLEDVVNELDLSASAIEKHGPLGTAPAELVKLVLAEKDQQIAMLKAGMVQIESKPENPSAFPILEENVYHGEKRLECTNAGMTLRDYFAATVSVSDLDDWSSTTQIASFGTRSTTPEKLIPEYLDMEAKYRYMKADAMLKARLK